MKFKEWIDKKVVVGSFPDIMTLQRHKTEIIINVSEQYNHQLARICIKNGLEYYWFPLNEFGKYDMGIGSIFAACWILYCAEQQNKIVYLHCHAGCNRSPTVFEAYSYMRTGKHVEYEKTPVDPAIINMFKPKEGEKLFTSEDYDKISNNRLLENIRQGFLPSITRMESFLNIIGKQFAKQLKYDNSINNVDVADRDTMKCYLSLDTALIESQIN